MKQTSSQGAARRKNITLYRNNDTFKNWLQILKESQSPFQIRHAKYSTTITMEDGTKVNFIVNRYRDKVFVANRMILSDLKKNPNTEQIKNTKHKRINYDVKNALAPCRFADVVNIDISSAYATTLLQTGLISDKTYRMLQSLEKHERLPAMGMLAKKAVVFSYENGQCVNVENESSENSEIFFYLIERVEECMTRLREICEEWYLFHWVDGIFIKNDVPPGIIRQLEVILEEYGYRYKYEVVKNFRLSRVDDQIVIQMNKNGDNKEYKFADTNLYRNLEALIRQVGEMASEPGQDKVRLPDAPSPMLESPRGYESLDYSPWLAGS